MVARRYGLVFGGGKVGLLNVNGYYDALLTYLDHAVEERFLRPEHRGIIQVAESPEAMLDLLENYEPIHVGKWMDRDQI